MLTKSTLWVSISVLKHGRLFKINQLHRNKSYISDVVNIQFDNDVERHCLGHMFQYKQRMPIISYHNEINVIFILVNLLVNCQKRPI